MCGFLCEFTFQNQERTPKEQFEQLLSLSKHRGPDSTKVTRCENYQLGFHRLAILDLTEQGNQPKYSPSKRYHVVFNGEIYNFRDLQKEYELYSLRSTSDTEVLVHLFDLLGIKETLKTLNGMFAISVIDTKTECLYLSRDFAGIKPLFYGVSNYGIIAASQFNQVFGHPWFSKSLQLIPSEMKAYFALGYMQAPNTIYNTIFQVHPGELIQVSNKGGIKKEIVTHFPKYLDASHEPNFDVNVKNYNKLLGNVIKDQLVSDVPIAAFLSGGIDSPLVCALAKKSKPDIETFTIAVDSIKHDESKAALNYAQHLGTNHHTEHVSARDLLTNVDTHFKSLSEPLGDYSSIPTYLITKLARKTHTVMLSGDGGDELFFGYPRMLDVLAKKPWFKIPFGIRKPMVRLGIKLRLWYSWAPYNNKTFEDFVFSKQIHISSKHLDRFIPHTEFSKELKSLYKLPKKMNKKNHLHWLRYNEFYAHMQRVLIKVDRMSMANSLEVRVPFLDKESIRFAWQCYPKIEKNNFQLKGLLKSVLSFHYPKELIQTNKKGFSIPMEHWLHEELKDDVKKLIFDTPFYGNSYTDVAAIRAYVNDFFKGKHQEFWGVWHIYAWQKWALNEKLI